MVLIQNSLNLNRKCLESLDILGLNLLLGLNPSHSQSQEGRWESQTRWLSATEGAGIIIPAQLVTPNERAKSLGAIPIFSILYSTSLPGPKSRKKEILENLIPHAVKNE